MGNKKFLARLAKELPDWVARGWVKAGADRAILDHVAAQRSGTPWLTYAYSILGVLLFGSGIITYFAANWGEIAKSVKLAILFRSMWLAYGAAWHALRNDHAPLLGQALLLLGAILFGANIMLIAQIYHIDSHFPNGVLLWSVGALAGAYLVRSQPMLVAAIALGWLWTTPYHPDLFFAGPAFAAGRYGVACGGICKAVEERFGIPVITGMYPENPGVDMYRKYAYIYKTGIVLATWLRVLAI